MDNERTDKNDPASHLGRDDGEDRIVAALDHLREVSRGGGAAHWKSNAFRQKSCLQKWAEDLGVCLDPEQILPRLKRGGQEHDYFLEEEKGRCVKLTRSGVFGLTPGIDLALVPSGEDARRFHLWEASPYEYLERLSLQNLITPNLNRLEGIVIQDEDLAICISQPRLDLISVTQDQIDNWFTSLGFEIVTSAAYYRPDDNLGVFDAHDKNVVRSPIDPEMLIPFDIIPVQPNGGFLTFIEETIASGQTLSVVRTAHTTTRAAK